jgi:hypothetical protein
VLREAREVGEKLPEDWRKEFAGWLKAFADADK